MGFFDSFRKDLSEANIKKHGKYLAEYVLEAANLSDSIILRTSGADKLTPVEIRRWKFSLAVYHLASLSFHLLSLGHLSNKGDEAKEIMDFMTAYVKDGIDRAFEDWAPNIEGYIVDRNELNSAKDRFSTETLLKLSDLFAFAYTNRVPGYFEEFAKFVNNTTDPSGFSMGPGARLFLTHVANDFPNTFSGNVMVAGLLISKMHENNFEMIRKII